jgi:hypothetical protein
MNLAQFFDLNLGKISVGLFTQYLDQYTENDTNGWLSCGPDGYFGDGILIEFDDHHFSMPFPQRECEGCDVLVMEHGGECGCAPRAFLAQDIRVGHEDGFTGRRHSVVRGKQNEVEGHTGLM